MICQPMMAKSGGTVTKVEIARSNYEIDWSITIGGSEHKLTGDSNTFPYVEEQEIIYNSSVKSVKVTVQGDTLKIHLEGNAKSGGVEIGP